MIQFTDERPADDVSLSAVDRAYHWIRDAILTGLLPAGTPLHERELAARIGVSRLPVNQALRRIEAGGMAKSRHRTASIVVAWTERDLREVFNLRALLEGEVASLAADRASPDHIARLEGICDAMETEFADASVERGERLDRASTGNTRFHATLLDAAESERLGVLLSHLSNTPFVFRTYRWFGDEEVLRSLKHHREIILAIRAHDAGWAAAVMRAHILASRANLLSRAAAVAAPGRASTGEGARAVGEVPERKRASGG